MDWITLTIFSVISRSVYGVMTKILSNEVRVSPYTQSVLLPFAAGVISLICSPLLGGISLDITKIDIPILVLMILGQSFGNVFYFLSIKNLNNSTAQIIFSSILVFNTVLSVAFLHLRMSWLNVFGLICLMVAILIVVLNGKIILHKKGVVFMVVSAFLFSVFQLSSATLSKEVGTVTYLLFAYFGAAFVIYILKWRDVHKDLTEAKNIFNTFRIPVLTALPSIGNFVFAYFAYRIASEPGKVAMLLTSQVVLTVLLSHFVFKEKTHLLRKIGASILVVISAILIKG